MYKIYLFLFVFFVLAFTRSYAEPWTDAPEGVCPTGQVPYLDTLLESNICFGSSQDGVKEGNSVYVETSSDGCTNYSSSSYLYSLYPYMTDKYSFTCGDAPCSVPDEPFIDDNNDSVTYSAVSAESVTCESTPDFNAVAESAIIDCVPYYRCKFVPVSSENNDTTANDDNSTNPDGSCKAGYAKDSNGNCMPDSDRDNIPDSEDSAPDDSSQGGGSSDELDHDCNPGYVPAPDYAQTANCVPENIECAYPTPKKNGYPFKAITANVFSCIELKNRYSNGSYDHFTCPDGSVACYYNALDNNSSSAGNGAEDNNSSAGGDLDNNSTEPTNNDSNSSDFDVSGIEDRLDTINDNLTSGSIPNKLDSLSQMIDQKSAQNHSDLQNINGTLSSKLDLINQSINNIPSSSTDLSTTNGLLEEISDKLSPDLTENESDLDSELNSASDILNNALSTFNQSKLDIQALAQGLTPPTVSTSGNCVLSVPIFGGNHNYVLDLNTFAQFRPFLQFVLNLVLLFFTVRLYIAIARDVSKLVNL